MNTDFLAWCGANGVAWFGVEAANFKDTGRGLVATAPLPSGTLVVKVKAGALMSKRSAVREPRMARVVLQCCLSPHQTLALHVLHQVSKGPTSFWWPYLRTLPREYTTLMHFSGGCLSNITISTYNGTVKCYCQCTWKKIIVISHP